MYDDYQKDQNAAAARGMRKDGADTNLYEVSGSDWKAEAKKLRLIIMELSDRFTKTIRTYEDLLYNLDDDNLSPVLRKEKDGMKAEIKIAYNMIALEVERALSEEGYLLGRIVVEADRITQEVIRSTAEEGLLRASITIEADRITQEVIRANEAEGVLGSRITQTAEEIRLEVYNANQGLSSRIIQNAETIAAEVSRAVGEEAQLYGSLTIQADRITSEVSARITGIANLQSQISQTASEISLKVSLSDYNGNSIASLINQTATNIRIMAEKIDLYGYVTFNSLSNPGQSVINGGNISTNSITADKIRLDTLYVNKLAQYGYENSNYIAVYGSACQFFYGGQEYLTILQSYDGAAFSHRGSVRLALNQYGGNLEGSWALNGSTVLTAATGMVANGYSGSQKVNVGTSSERTMVFEYGKLVNIW